MLMCALCMFVGEPEGDDRDDRITIIAGIAVCGEHVGYVQDEAFSRAYGAAAPERQRQREI